MNIQDVFNTFKQIRKDNAGNLTIGRMLAKLEQFDDKEKVQFSDGAYFDGTYDSYRGYYEDLYIGWESEDKGFNTVGELKKTLNKALDHGVMYGYKGGEYSINTDTLVWFSTYGSTGDMIIDVQKLNGVVFVITKEDE